MGLLENAVDSISLGLEDYKSPEPKRILSAPRNLFAGVLLLFKQKLFELSPKGSNEVLIKEKMVPRMNASGSVEFVGKGKKTVDLQEIKERFKDLKIFVDWKRVDQIQQFRNDVEHYYSTISSDARAKTVSDCFLVIRDFIASHLGKEPRDVLGEKSWQILISENAVYDKEKKQCVATIEQVDWKSNTLQQALIDFLCEGCDSGLIYIPQVKKDRENNEFECKSCGKKYEFEKIAVASLENYSGLDNHAAIKDGGDPETIECPSCSNNSYIISEEQCAVCLGELEHICQRCDIPIPAEELELANGYCSWCNHMMSKDD